MKFSYPLIKKLVPKLKNKAQLVGALNLYSFESEDAGGNTVEITIWPNRYSDAASHWGIAREAAAILNLRPLGLIRPVGLISRVGKAKNFTVTVENKNLCPRYTAQYFEGLKVKPSPAWLQKILKDCGLRPINNVVDIMNYAMLETGQPLHAFDADKLEGGGLVIRTAKKDEIITSIDGIHYKLEAGMLVIADSKKPQAIAGIKGGKGSEVSSKTRRIIVESANFDPVSIYKTSKTLNLVTDASLRFSHGLSLALPLTGLTRVAQLLQEISGAQVSEVFDSFAKSLPRRILKFDIDRFNSFIGLNLNEKEAENYLKRLGFKSLGGKRWGIPILRTDIQDHQDLAEEVIRLYGYNKLKPAAPHVALHPSESDEIILLKDKIRKILTGFGLDEVYNYSFWDKGKVGLLNPVSQDKKYLRSSLLPRLLKNIEDNFRFFEKVKTFEIGCVFQKGTSGIKERLMLGIGLGVKKEESLFEMKGIVDELLKGLGLVDFFFNGLQIESDHEIIGSLSRRPDGVSLAEFDLEKLLTLVEGELSFEPLPKFPAVMRDISILVSAEVRIGEIVRVLQQSNLRLIEDIDLIDEYIDKRWGGLQSLTFRIVFQAEDRTLTKVEVDDEMEKITKLLRQEFNARVR